MIVILSFESPISIRTLSFLGFNIKSQWLFEFQKENFRSNLVNDAPLFGKNPSKTKQICLVKSNDWFRESNLLDEGEIRLSFAFLISY